MNWKDILKEENGLTISRKIVEWIKNNVSAHELQTINSVRGGSPVFASGGAPHPKSSELISLMNRLDEEVKGRGPSTAQDFLEQHWAKNIGIGKPNKPQAENEFRVLH